jgi:signal transduction histidine kinase
MDSSLEFDVNIPFIISVSGALFLLWSLFEPAGLLLISSPDVFRDRYLIGYVTIIPSSLVLIWGGRWVSENLPVEYNSTVAVSVVAGGGTFLVFNIFLMMFFPTESPWLVTSWVRWALSMGMCLGLIIGVLYSRGISNALEAERQALRADHLREHRELITQMNSILRHEVLNSAQVISGNSRLLKESDEKIDPDDNRIDRLLRQGDELSDIVQEVQALLHVVDDDYQFEAVNVSDVLRSEADKIKNNYPNVTIEMAVQEDVFVKGDELFGRVCGNLLRNAAQHNDSESVHITVYVETIDGEAKIAIEDTGDGIPADQLDGLFDHPDVGTHGLGLYIVKQVLERYGGTIELVETGNEGTTFEITLPLSERATPRQTV